MVAEKVDDFIGRRFGKDGHLKVVSGYRDRKDRTIFVVQCAECAKDSELFGNGNFKICKGHLLNGKIPCGCSKKPKWKEWQQEVRVKRECSNRGCEFLGFGKWCGCNTRVMLRCSKDGFIWDSTRISSFLDGAGCPKCAERGRGYLKRKSDLEMNSIFMETGVFLDGTKFWRSDREDSNGWKNFWCYTCPKCSNDIFVKAGLCSGVFESYSSNLRQGQLSCRCAKTYRWTQPQRELQLKNILKDEGSNSEFVGWKNQFGYASSRRSKIVVLCKEHGEYSATINNFVDKGSRCPSCSKRGFNPNIPAHIYVLKIEGTSGDFTGYGISNNVPERIREHICNLSEYGFKIVESQSFLTTGSRCIEIEKSIKVNFILVKQEVEGFKTEATKVSLYPQVLDFVRSMVENTVSDIIEKELNSNI